MDESLHLDKDLHLVEKHIKKTTIVSQIISIIVAVVSAAGVCYGFYFKTTDALTSHTAGINELKADVNDIKNGFKNSAYFQGATQAETKNMHDRMDRMENNVTRIETKLDALIQLNIQMSKNQNNSK